MTQFHEGQEVEVVRIRGYPRPFRVWDRAKVVTCLDQTAAEPNLYVLQFPDGTRSVFDAEHIRAGGDRSVNLSLKLLETPLGD